MISDDQNKAGQETASRILGRLERIPFSRFHWRLVMILGFGDFFDAYDSLAIAVALAVVFTTLHIGFVYAGVLLSSAYLGQFVGALAGGYLAERYGRKAVFITAILVFGLFSLAAAVSWNYTSLLWARFIQGFGLGAEVPMTVALFNEYIKGENRGFVFTLYHTSFAWGLALAPLIGAGLFSVLPPTLGWRLVFGIGGIPVIVALLGIRLLPESVRWLVQQGRLSAAEAIVARMEAQFPADRLPPPKPLPPVSTAKTRITELWSSTYRRRTVLSWVQWFTTYFVTYGFSIWLPTLYTKLGGLPVTAGLLLSAISNFSQLAMAFLTAWLMERLGRKPSFLIGYGIMVAGGLFGLAGVAVGHSTRWPVLFGAGLLMGIGSSVNAIDAGMYAAELYPTRMRAWAIATGTGWNRIGSFIAPILVGALLAAHLGLDSVFAMFTLVSLIGGVVMLALGIETKHQALEELAR